MKSLIPPNLSPAAQTLAEILVDARQRELDALAGLTPDQMMGMQMRGIEPPIWEMGHVGWFQERWILKRLDDAPALWPAADTLYDSFNIPNAERWDLAFPTQKQTLTYITAVLQCSLQRLAGREITEQERYFYWLAILHEDIHSHTMLMIRQTLSYPRPLLSTFCPTPPPIDEDFELHDVTIPGGTFMLGASPDKPFFVWDNEKWAHPHTIAPFRIAATPVTTAQYQAFVEAGGYQERDYWSDEGWAWRVEANAVQPVFWRREADGSWSRRVFTDYLPLQPFEPMIHVNFYEANAYCAWADRRLPSEAEWEMAASAEPSFDGRTISSTKRLYPWGDEEPQPQHVNMDGRNLGPIDVRCLPAGDSAFGCRQMLGNVTEWTADTLNPYPGFVIDPYDTMSAPSFGQHKVLRGSSWAMPARVLRNTWRDWYPVYRNNIFAGFRTCAL